MGFTRHEKARVGGRVSRFSILLQGGVYALLAVQIGWIFTGPFRDHSYGNWAPFHEHATYHVDAWVDGRALQPHEIRERYGVYRHFYDVRTDRDWQLNRMQHILGLIERVEAAAPPEEQARVVVRYRINGGEEEEWAWSPNP